MPNAFQDAISAGLSSLRGAAGVTIVYRRGNYQVEIPNAVPGATEYGVTELADVVLETYTDRDYLFRSCDLVLNREVVEPEKGDTIEETIQGKKHVYQVVNPEGNAERAFSYSDTNHDQLRVHTKLVEVASNG